MPTNQRGKAIYRVRELESPIHKEFRGLRVEITLPNMAGRKPFSDVVVPSFDKPYFVCHFGDYETWEALHAKWPAICKAIYRQGFTEIVQYKPEDYRDTERDAERARARAEEDGIIPGIDTDEGTPTAE
jgi:hypothetical protein